MTKFRVIKSVGRDSIKPYFIQEWKSQAATWAPPALDISYSTIKQAVKQIRQWQKWETERTTPAEVVWEDEDE